jgi:ribosomal protein L32
MIHSLFIAATTTLVKGRQYYFGWLRLLALNSSGNNNEWWQPQWVLATHDTALYHPDIFTNDETILDNDDASNLQLDDLSIWFAVPKQKISRMKKRMKTTLRKRIPIRRDIITDPRTGELTLRHRLPFNWKKYLPNVLNPMSASPPDNAQR